jgi:CRISPR-associated protein Csy1
MSDVSQSDQPGSFRAVIALFLKERLSDKLDKLASDDPKRNELIEQYQYEVWLEDASRRVTQIQVVTHSLKPVHPDAKGTNLYVHPSQLTTLDVLGSHVLTSQFEQDVVGNAAALDVYKLLKLTYYGQTLLDALLAEDAGALEALDADPQKARQLKEAFVGLIAVRQGKPVAHVLAKQLYWCVGTNPCDDQQYHLLEPLYPTSLIHTVYSEIQDARFSEDSKAARQARRDKVAFDGVIRDYPNLAVQKLGGTKPQNISQLNSERKGVNYLLSSSPPQWKGSSPTLPRGDQSIFDRVYGTRGEVRRAKRGLLRFLQTDPPQNVQTRRRVEHYLDCLIAEVITLSTTIQEGLPPGWSLDPAYDNLRRIEKLWLDPRRATLEDEDEFAQEWCLMEWPVAVAKRFAQWVNGELAGKMTLGDDEAREWAKTLRGDDAWTKNISRLRKEFAAQERHDG